MYRLIGRWGFYSFMVLWLGVAMPLLCVPGVSSNHSHGPHSVFERGPIKQHEGLSAPITPLVDRVISTPRQGGTGPETFFLNAVGLLVAGILLAAPTMSGVLGKGTDRTPSRLLFWRLWRPPRSS